MAGGQVDGPSGRARPRLTDACAALRLKCSGGGQWEEVGGRRPAVRPAPPRARRPGKLVTETPANLAL